MAAARTRLLLASIALVSSVTHGQVPVLEPSEQITSVGGTSVEARGDRVWVGGASSARLYRRTPGGSCDPSCWQLQLTLSPPTSDPAYGRWITWKQKTLVISGPAAPSDGSNGGAYVYDQQNRSFVLRQRLHENLSLFGRTHALADDYIVVNSHNVFSPTPVGPYLYHRNASGSWDSLGLLASSAQLPDNFDQYGINAAMTRRSILVGADEGGYVAAFRLRSGVWEETQILRAWDAPAGFVTFGRGLAIHGRTAVVGAYIPGVLYVFERRNGTWQPLQKLERWDAPQTITIKVFGQEVVSDGQRIAALDSEAIYVYERHAGVWTPAAKLVNSEGFSGGFSNDGPFDSLHLDGSYVYVVNGRGVWRFDLASISN